MNYVQLLLSYAVENELIVSDVAKVILKAIVDAAVAEVGNSEAD